VQEGDLRLRPLRLPEDVELALAWYADPEVLRFSEGGAAEPYSAHAVRQMYEVLAASGELFVIEVETPKGWRAIGDATLGTRGIPIAIGDRDYRSHGYGARVLALLVERARSLGWSELVTNGISVANERSLRMFARAGFLPAQRIVDEQGEETVTMR